MKLDSGEPAPSLVSLGTSSADSVTAVVLEVIRMVWIKAADTQRCFKPNKCGSGVIQRRQRALAVLWILKRLLFNSRENVTSEEKSKMTAGFQSRSCSRGLNCLPLFSLHLSVYLVLSLSESVTGYDCIQSQGVCCLSTPGLRQSKWCTEQPFCLHTHTLDTTHSYHVRCT